MEQLGHIRDTAMAFLGVDELRITKPLVANDTIHVDLEVTDKKATKKPDRGVVTFKETVKNQKGDTLMSFYRAILIRRKQGVKTS